jgi:hypothetical protein
LCITRWPGACYPRPHGQRMRTRLDVPVPPAPTAIAGHEHGDLAVEVPAATLQQLGMCRVVASPRACAEELHALIAQLQRARSDHTWRGFSPRDVERIADELLAFENSRRTTRVFYYHGIAAGGARELLGTGAVSPELRRDAPPGFAVVSRCYILERFRSARLYEPLLKHRVAQAELELGDRLRGIHFGSSNPRVLRAIQTTALAMRFLYVGREHVVCCGERFTVHDFLALSERFRSELLRPQPPGNPGGAELHGALRALCRGELGAGGYLRVRRLVDATDQAAAFPAETRDAIASLLAFLAAIPVIEPESEPDGVSDV